MLVALAMLSLGTLISIFLAAVLALGLDPPVSALVRRGWGRGRGRAGGVRRAVRRGLRARARHRRAGVGRRSSSSSTQLPALLGRAHVQARLPGAGLDRPTRTTRSARRSRSSPQGLPDAANALLGIAGGVFGSILSLVTLTFLALFLLMERPTITDWLFGFTPPAVEARWRPVVENSISAVSSSLIGNVAISVVAGTVAGLSAWALGLPVPARARRDHRPARPDPAGRRDGRRGDPRRGRADGQHAAAAIMLVIQLIYQQLENYVVYPIVYREAVELSPFTTIVAVLIAGSILGVVGAILAVPFAAVIKTVLHEAGAPRQARMAALREASAPS